MAPEKVERVLLNLLTNALRHTPSDRAVAVVVEPRNGRVVIAVDDSGQGLTATAARRMFERCGARIAFTLPLSRRESG